MAIVSFIQGITEPIKRILGSFNVLVAQKPVMKLGHIFAKPQNLTEKEQRIHANHSIPCSDCDQEYIGQTKGEFGTRLKKHQKAISFSKRQNSALSEHAFQANHTIMWQNSRIITTNPRFLLICCLEAWQISSTPALLNHDDSGLLPDTYLHFLNG